MEERKDEIWRNKGGQDSSKKPFGYRILVVDDEKHVRMVIADFLSMYGYQCITANNGLDALDQFNRSTFDAVITDVGMPEMDGIALTRKLSSRYPNLPVMVMTGYGEEYLDAAIRAGAWDFIGKPFSPHELMLRLTRMMDYRSPKTK